MMTELENFGRFLVAAAKGYATANCFFDTPEEALALFNVVQEGITFEKAREIGFQF